MAGLDNGYLPDRQRPAWFATALVALFVAATGIGLAGVSRAPREAPTQFENRKTVALPAMPRSWSALRDYPARFETFFDDRFGMRGPLVRLDHWARAVVFGVSPVPKVLIGKSGWLYFLGEDGKAFDRWYRGGEPGTDTTVRAISDEVSRRREFLTNRGIAYLIVVVPEKYSIYPEFLPDSAAQRAMPTPVDRIVTAIGTNSMLRVVDLRAPLLAAKGANRLYYRTDSHWNYLGAIAAYEAFMPDVAKLLPGLTIASVTLPRFRADAPYYSGDLAEMLLLPRQFREDDFVPLKKSFWPPESWCAKQDPSKDSPGIETFAYRCPNVPHHTALVYRDSMGIWLMPMLAANFARTTFVSSAAFDPTLVESIKPDIVIEEIVERSLGEIAAHPMPLQPR